MQLPESATLVPHRVSSGKSPNWAVETVSAPGAVTDPKKVRIAATIRGYETDPAKKTVTLLVNNKVIQTKTVDIPANGRTRVEFIGLDASYGLNRGEVATRWRSDSLEADNPFQFSDSIARSRARFSSPTIPARARALTYFNAALDAAGDSPFTAEAVPCDLTVWTDAVEVRVRRSCRLPIACPLRLRPALREFVQQGGSAFVTLGPSSASREKVPLTNIAIDTSRYSGRESERFLVTSQVDGGHSDHSHCRRVRRRALLSINSRESRESVEGDRGKSATARRC